MTTPNPLAESNKIPQNVSWKHIKQNKDYSFEFIKPIVSIVQDHGGRGGAYFLFCSEVLENITEGAYKLHQGHQVVVHIPVKTFVRSWVGIDHRTRKDISAEDSVRITFVKTTDKSIYIKDIEKVQPTIEHLQFFEEVKNHPHYNRLKRETVVREREEL